MRTTVAALLLLCAFGAFSQGPAPTPPKASDPPKEQATGGKKAGEKPQESPEARSSISIQVSPTISSGATNKPADGQEKSSSDWWGIVFSGAVALFTLGLLIANWGMWGATRDNASAAADNAEAAKKSASAAIRTVELSERVERARVFTVAAEPTLGDQATEDHLEILVEVKLQNVGRTPGILLGFMYGVYVGSMEGVNQWAVERENEVKRRASEILLPSQPFTLPRIRNGLRITRENFQALRLQGANRLYVFGFAEFRDVFDVTRRQHFLIKWVPWSDGDTSMVQSGDSERNREDVIERTPNE